MQKALKEVPRRGGLYNWIFNFKGEIRQYSDALNELKNYDIVQINMSPIDQIMIPEVSRILKGTSTVLVLNNDYVCEKWTDWNLSPLYYEELQRLGDCVFGTEPYQTSHLIKGSFCMPHPTWTHMVNKIGVDRNTPKKSVEINFLFHWWEGRTYDSGLLVKRLRDYFTKKGKTLHARLISYNYGNDRLKQWTKTLFDELIPLKDYWEWIQTVGNADLVVDLCSYHTYGRNGVDCAAMGIPLVSSKGMFSSQHCYPEMSVDSFDLVQVEKKIIRVIEDKPWVSEQLLVAKEKMEYFSYANSMERYLAMIKTQMLKVSKPKNGHFYEWDEEGRVFK